MATSNTKETAKKTATKKSTTKKAQTVRHEVVIALPSMKVPKVLTPIQGFVDFIREQGVVGLAVGLVLGTQIKALVDTFIVSFVNPLLGLLLPGSGNLAEKSFQVTFNNKTQKFMWGLFLMQVISFVIVAAIVYFTVHSLKLDKLDKKKDKK